MLRKGFNGLVKDVDTAGRTVTGYFSTFDFIDSDGDVIKRGAFAKSISERGPTGSNRIFHLWQHWTDSILGKPSKLVEDEKGLYFETTIAKTKLGDDVLQLYLDGIINEHSIGFNVIQSERNEADEVTTIKEVRLWEGSTVTWGANENTPSTGVKLMNYLLDDVHYKGLSLRKIKDGDMVEAVKNQLLIKIDRLTRALEKGKYTDETFELLQYELAAITQLLKSLGPDQPPKPTNDELIKAFEKSLRNG